MTKHVAVITGAGSGIGQALAQKFCSEGYRLGLCDIHDDNLNETVRNLGCDPHDVFSAKVDVSSKEEMVAFADEIQKKFGQVDVVVNNAGISICATFETTKDDDFKRLMGINFWGVVHGSRVFLPHLKARPAATIIKSSIFGVVGAVTNSAYCASKFAVLGFSDCLREELRGAGVHVLTVAPGAIDTAIAKNSVIGDTTGLLPKGVAPADAFKYVARVSPSKAAKAIIRASQKKKDRLLIGLDAYGLYFGTKIFGFRLSHAYFRLGSWLLGKKESKSSKRKGEALPGA